MFPAIAASMSASVGLVFAANKADADMISPDCQQPHCGTSSAIQAFCIGWLASADSPSMVVIFLPLTDATVVMQERIGFPSRCTVQAPHCAMPQPNLVPVMPRFSRKTQSKGVSELTSTCCRLPLTIMAIMVPPYGEKFESRPSRYVDLPPRLTENSLDRKGGIEL